MIHGVLDRVLSISDREIPLVSEHRPPYHYQVPLEFIPGLGKVKLRMLIEAFGSEMAILHRVSELDLASIVGNELAGLIVRARNGELGLSAGGGGTYGRVSL